jgi:drug/metabolite transporter (DMT)-like permease
MNLWISYTKLGAAQAIIGMNFVLAKCLMPYFPMTFLCFIRFAIGAVIMGVICYLKGLNPLLDDHGHRLKKGDGFILLSQAMCAGFLFNIFILAGLQYTEASTAGIISSTTPAAIAILSYFILKDKLSPRVIASIAMAVLGVMILSIGEGTQSAEWSNYYGEMLILIAVLPEALFTVIAKWYKKQLNCYVISFIVCAINAVLFLPLALGSLKGLHVTMTWNITGLLAIYGILGSSGFFILWYQGLQRAPASMAALFTSVMPVSATVLGVWFLKEAITAYDLIGILFVVVSIFFGSLSFKSFKSKTILFND